MHSNMLFSYYICSNRVVRWSLHGVEGDMQGGSLQAKQMRAAYLHPYLKRHHDHHCAALVRMKCLYSQMCVTVFVVHTVHKLLNSSVRAHSVFEYEWC